MTVRLITGDCREQMRLLPDESVHCVVTSPPYWGLRDYGVTGQLGMETTYFEHIEAMVDVFREVRRVLRKDGTLWLNYGDSYATQINGRSAHDTKLKGNDDRTFRDKPFSTIQGDLKPKDLCGIPWRVAFALQADGWYLRQDIIWSKPNPMPESVRDRCTKSHEYIFLLSKSERYFYDAEAISEPAIFAGKTVTLGEKSLSIGQATGANVAKSGNALVDQIIVANTRNKRSVWEIATAPYSEAHFATFPPALIEPCIKAGCPEKVCAKCGAPWVLEVERGNVEPTVRSGDYGNGAGRNDGDRHPSGGWKSPPKVMRGVIPSCSCGTHLTGLGVDHWTTECVVPGTCLDPFGGAGTTGLVADRLGRNAILIELNPEYAAMAERRIRNDAGMFADIYDPHKDTEAYFTEAYRAIKAEGRMWEPKESAPAACERAEADSRKPIV